MITLQNLSDRGYIEYPVPKYSGFSNAQKFFQKKVIVIEDADEFYIDAYVYDFRNYDPAMKVDIVFDCQFNGDYAGTTFNINTVGWENEEKTLARVEEFFMEIYKLSRRYRKIKED